MQNVLEKFIFAVNASAAQVRYEDLEGQRHIVVPTVSMAPGVWNGSQGPVLYLPEDFTVSVPGWNHRPTVNYHPEINGKGVSACQPQVLNEKKVGVVLNTSFKNKLRMETWLNDARIDVVDPRIREAIMNKKGMEVSTGLFVDIEEKEGKYGGKEYVGIARNHRPDHLALLPDKVGAYSMADGGGLLRNEEGMTETQLNQLKEFIQSNRRHLLLRGFDVDRITAGTFDQLTDNEAYEVWNRQFTDAQRKKMASAGTAMSDGSFPIVNTSDLKNAIRAVGRASDPATAKKHIIKRAKALGALDLIPKDWLGTTNNELSLQQTAGAVSRAIAARYMAGGASYNGWVEDIYNTYCIYCVDGQMYKQDYKKTDTGIELVGEPTPVQRVTMYQTEDGKPIANEENQMDKKKIVDGIVTNEKSGWKEADREFLMGLTPERLTIIDNAAKPAPTPQPPTPSPQPAPQPNPTPEPQPQPQPTLNQLTEEEYIKRAPPRIQTMLQQGVQAFNERKADLIQIITNAPGNQFTKEYLDTKNDINELAGIAALCQNTTAPTSGTTRPPMFLGGGPTPRATVPVINEEPMVAPSTERVYNIKKKEAAK